MNNLLIRLMMPLEINIPDPTCQWLKATQPFGNYFGGNILGLGIGWGPVFVVVLLALLLFLYGTRVGRTLLFKAIAAFVILIVLGLILRNPGAFFYGIQGC